MYKHTATTMSRSEQNHDEPGKVIIAVTRIVSKCNGPLYGPKLSLSSQRVWLQTPNGTIFGHVEKEQVDRREALASVRTKLFG